ncbi:interferon-induced protein with tetratricopeptide repeats 5-like [Oxyura jamaicensis]|uniref:interferon-induced protein with tetratricopeptide repeats 5-like n=1 Tax=Oxyura jamaicensis TaxID=8884 RepID=UPI0015A6AC03|nr:interferon-induced protein with tetratricopeptide repeats 5-like [Oxyura jamaicensis]XP_035186602.1 interferon-induced protein with tetratricopeptide repeats 5-like [Oxyura jamaicensis]
MSTISNNSLKKSLLQLECHFTWTLLKEDVDLDYLEESIIDLIDIGFYENLRNYNLLAYVCHLKHSNTEALENLQKAEEFVQKCHPNEIDMKSLVTWGNYAWIYYHMARYEEAQAYVSQVKNSCKKLSGPAQLKIQFPEIYAEQGWALLKFGKKYYERAKECFEKALSKEPNNPEFNAGYAIAVYRLEEHCNGANEEASSTVEILKRAVELNQRDTFLMALLALKLQELHQDDEGERYIEAAMQKTPNLPYFLRYAAIFYRRKGEVDKAVEILRRALAVTPKSIFLRHQMGVCYRTKLKQLERTENPPQDQVEKLIQECIFHFKAVIDQKTKFWSSYTDLAVMYAKARKYKEAEETFQKAFQINTLTFDDKQTLCYRYGYFHQYCKRSESEAIRYYKEGLKIGEDSYGRLMCKISLKKLLRERIRKGLEDEADFGTLGFIHQLDGENREAIECYEKAIELNPDSEEYLSALCELRLSLSS